ncbi:MAG: ABC transporter permease [Anaerolineae bacterium]|nr:ABC transporter permease [Anaerolineae bacterium]
METVLPTSPLIRVRQFLLRPTIGPLIALLLACAFFTTQTPRLLTINNFSFIFQQSIVVSVLAIGQTLIILTGGIDLANGAVMSLGAVYMVHLASRDGFNPFIAIGIGFAITSGIGFINGLLVTRLRLPPFIVTLGMLGIVYALSLIYTTETIPAREAQTFLGNGFKVGDTLITYGTVAMMLLFLVTWFMLRETSFGRHIYAIGNNAEAVRLAGISTDRLLVAVYTLAGLLYGVAALLLIARTEVGDPQTGVAGNFNLESITAVVLGGTSLFGGRGNVLGTLIGAIIVSVFRNGLLLMGIPSIYQLLITGILVIMAVSVDQLSQRGGTR